MERKESEWKSNLGEIWTALYWSHIYPQSSWMSQTNSQTTLLRILWSHHQFITINITAWWFSASIKIVDIWLLASLIYPFVIILANILLHIARLKEEFTVMEIRSHNEGVIEEIETNGTKMKITKILKELKTYILRIKIVAFLELITKKTCYLTCRSPCRFYCEDFIL